MPKKKEHIVRFTHDPKNLPQPTKAYLARLDAMTDEEITAAALSDPDNPPWTAENFKNARLVHALPLPALRAQLQLTQKQFAEAFRLPLSTVKDWEQMRYMPDQAARNYLQVIAHNPDMVREALKQ